MLALCLASASAFSVAPARSAAPSPSNTRLMSSKDALEADAKKLNPLLGYYDPLALVRRRREGRGNRVGRA